MNRIAAYVALAVLLALLGGSPAYAGPKPETVKLKNGTVVILADGRAVTRRSDGKPTPFPEGTYDTRDGRTIVVGSHGKVESVSVTKSAKKDSGGKGKKIRNEDLVLKDGTRASIDDGRLWVVINQHGGQGKAEKGSYKTKDGRRIEVGSGGVIVSIQ